MSAKTISINDDVYKQLMEIKREDESFSDVIEPLMKKQKTDLSEFFGALKNSDLMDEIEDDSKRIRASVRSRFWIFWIQAP